MTATDEKLLPIAEIFTSPQGEGLYTGTLMTFVRLAGCSVGKSIPGSTYQMNEPSASGIPTKTERKIPHDMELARKGDLPIWQEECTLYDGRKFLCDTDFRVKERWTPSQILAYVPHYVNRICITGGEPLNYDLTRLVELALPRGIKVHIETSGTVSIKKAFPNWPSDVAWRRPRERDSLWIAVSPKFGVLDEMLYIADEVKLLVDENFDEQKLPTPILSHGLIYIQPVNGTMLVNEENMRRCLRLQERHPHWRLSSQAHKLWGVR